MNLPAVFLPAGPMLRGNWRGATLGSGSDSWKYWAELRAGNLDEQAWAEIEEGIARSAGTCMTMGTAATMMSLAETLGLALPGSSSIPAVDSNHSRMAEACGRRIVGMVWEDLKPRDVLSAAAFDNAIAVLMALGGSTNAVVHLIAMAGRAGIKLELARFDEISRRVPVLANVRPSGKYLMEDFYYAGGLRALMAEMKSLLDLGQRNVNGAALGVNIESAKSYNHDVIAPLERPVQSSGGLAVLRGNLAPDGAVIKPSATEPKLLEHTGKAVVFEDYDEMARRIDDDNLAVDAASVLLLRNAGPLGGPGMPEWGMLPIPKNLLKQGVRDMVRISDARMSGTSYGACILHVAPESFVGGPLALVQTGDEIEVDVPARRIHLHVAEEELSRRRAAWKAPPPRYARGYGAMFSAHIGQADEGCDFDFLAGTAPVPEPEIH
jgi:dihydroxy-acid dehydratase